MKSGAACPDEKAGGPEEAKLASKGTSILAQFKDCMKQ